MSELSEIVEYLQEVCEEYDVEIAPNFHVGGGYEDMEIWLFDHYRQKHGRAAEAVAAIIEKFRLTPMDERNGSDFRSWSKGDQVGGVRITLRQERSLTCERVVIDTKTVTKEVPVSNKTKTVTVEEPIYEWRCKDPILESQAS